MKKYTLGLSILIIVLLTITACSSQEKMATSYAPEMPASESVMMEDGNEIGINTNENVEGIQFNSDLKIIRTSNLSIQTLKFDDMISYIEKDINRVNGYIQYSEIDGIELSQNRYNDRMGTIIARIPVDSYDDFLNDINDFGSISNKSESIVDVSLSYMDKESRINSLDVQTERLLEIMAEADDVEMILAIENSLTDIRYEKENLTSEVRKLDNEIEYSTFNIDVFEVEEEMQLEVVEKTLGDRIVYTFKDSIDLIKSFFEVILIVVLGLSPIIILIVVISFIVYKITKKVKDKKTKVEK